METLMFNLNLIGYGINASHFKSSHLQLHVERDPPGWDIPESLYHRDNALLYIAYVMLIWAAPIPADSWHCSLWP